MGKSSKSLQVLKYHQINDCSNDQSGICVDREVFKNQITTLLKWGYKPISVNDLTGFIYDFTDIPDKSFIVTFDDGYQDIFTNVLPILESLSVPAHVFLISDYLEKNWDKDSLLEADENKKLLGLVEILRLKRSGLFTFGSHSKTHKKLNELPDDELYQEIVGSKFKLEKLIDDVVDSFAYPYGIYDERIKAVVKEAGYKTAFLSKNKGLGKNLDPYAIARINMHNSDKALKFWYKIFKSEIRSFNLVN